MRNEVKKYLVVSEIFFRDQAESPRSADRAGDRASGQFRSAHRAFADEKDSANPTARQFRVFCDRLLKLSIRRSTLAAVGEECSTKRAYDGFEEGTMFRSKIAEWSYQLGCVSAAVAVIYRTLWFGGLGARWFGAPRVLPHSFVDLSILLLVISIASNAQGLVHRDDGKPVA
jgi:hypothetical protein